jgi:hypothetical protein
MSNATISHVIVHVPIEGAILLVVAAVFIDKIDGISSKHVAVVGIDNRG